MFRIFNTLSSSIELFVPHSKDEITMYVCGPTVYDRMHLGNLRSIVFYDVLYRVLKASYPSVKYVRNITDVDDKIIAKAKELGCETNEVTEDNILKMKEDLKKILVLDVTQEPKATEHIPQMISGIEKLISNGNAYKSGEDVFFSVQSYSGYGNLTNRKLKDMIAGKRIKVTDNKKFEHDFTLWKGVPKSELGWESPFGYGRPGWHIECSVMSYEALGGNFDIHGGGADLQFPHHENEIAQSVCMNAGTSFAKFWIHNGFLAVNGEKMSKSIGNVQYLHSLLEQGYSGHDVRFALLSAHYRKPMDFNQHLIETSSKAIKKFTNFLHKALQTDDINLSQEINLLDESHIPTEAKDALFDNINLSKYVSIIHSSIKNYNRESNTLEDKKLIASQVWNMGHLIGIFSKEMLLPKS